MLGSIFTTPKFIKTNLFANAEENKKEIQISGTRIIRSLSLASFFVIDNVRSIKSRILRSRDTKSKLNNEFDSSSSKRSKSVDSVITRSKFLYKN